MGDRVFVQIQCHKNDADYWKKVFGPPEEEWTRIGHENTIYLLWDWATINYAGYNEILTACTEKKKFLCSWGDDYGSGRTICTGDEDAYIDCLFGSPMPAIEVLPRGIDSEALKMAEKYWRLHAELQEYLEVTE